MASKPMKIIYRNHSQPYLHAVYFYDQFALILL